MDDLDLATESWDTSTFHPKEVKATPPMYIVRWMSQVHNGGFKKKDGTFTKPRNQGRPHARCEHCHYSFITEYMRQCRRIDNWFGGRFWICRDCLRKNKNTYQNTEE